MDPTEFAAKWKGSTLTERAASQSHFNDICGMLGWRTPSDLDPTGAWFAFEKGAEKLGGEDGFADVWMKDRFAWEYKGKRANLPKAYKQLNDYREDLGNPPLLVVCDLNRFEIHTNFTGTAKKVYAFTLDDLANAPTEPLRILRALFSEPERLRPAVTRQELTEEAAKDFANLAIGLRARGHEPQAVAHFLDQLLFCLFAEDAGLLPRGIIERLSEATRADPDGFTAQLGDLFARMSSPTGGWFGTEHIEWFDGSLFDEPATIPLVAAEVDIIRRVAKLDWAEIEPAIFGTLFERGLDPDRRSQLGAHYTDRASIERLVEPVLMVPLRREYAAMQARVHELLALNPGMSARRTTKPEIDPRIRAWQGFLDRLRAVTVLDPACGSGNFLYVALQSLKDLEREAIHWGSLTLQAPTQYPQVGPGQLRGIEINSYAAELARVTIWIGEIQWMLRNGWAYMRDPILRPLHAIETKDALIDWSDPEHPREADWPAAEFIIGNPPFLGGKWLRRNLGDHYVDALFAVYQGRVPQEADFVTYWHARAGEQITAGHANRVGLLATQAIRAGANRRVLDRIRTTCQIFAAWSDEPWVLAGANVHVSFLCYDNGTERERLLNGQPVAAINANLTSGLDVGRAALLPGNAGISFMGDTKGGPFDIPADVAQRMLKHPNADGRPNSDVVRPWVNGEDLTGRPRGHWIIDFGVSMPMEEAALYEAPFEYVRTHVRPHRISVRRASYAESWWLHVEARPGMRMALAHLGRYLATTRVAKHRLFAWLSAPTLADSRLIVFARDDDGFFGILHSRAHQAWAHAQGSRHETRPTYTPTTCFETFPFPRSTSEEHAEISAAAKRLDELRRGWLDPLGITEEVLRTRTMTNLYNEMPTWLRDCHDRLDRAVLGAYGWPSDITNDDLLARLLRLNLERARVADPIR